VVAFEEGDHSMEFGWLIAVDVWLVDWLLGWLGGWLES